jgi:hypothetical protein
MSLFAKLGLLQTVEVSESEKQEASFASHSAGALGITGSTTSSTDYLEICLERCPPNLMYDLIEFHLNAR